MSKAKRKGKLRILAGAMMTLAGAVALIFGYSGMAARLRATRNQRPLQSKASSW